MVPGRDFHVDPAYARRYDKTVRTIRENETLWAVNPRGGTVGPCSVAGVRGIGRTLPWGVCTFFHMCQAGRSLAGCKSPVYVRASTPRQCGCTSTQRGNSVGDVEVRAGIAGPAEKCPGRRSPAPAGWGLCPGGLGQHAGRPSTGCAPQMGDADGGGRQSKGAGGRGGPVRKREKRTPRV